MQHSGLGAFRFNGFPDWLHNRMGHFCLAWTCSVARGSSTPPCPTNTLCSRHLVLGPVFFQCPNY